MHSSIHIVKQIPKYLATGLQRPEGTNSPPAEVSTQGFNVKLNTCMILFPLSIHNTVRLSFTEKMPSRNVYIAYYVTRSGWPYYLGETFTTEVPQTVTYDDQLSGQVLNFWFNDPTASGVEILFEICEIEMYGEGFIVYTQHTFFFRFFFGNTNRGILV
jgi:hypothetical protein